MASATWPVEIVDFGALVGPVVAPEEPTQATRTFDTDSETHGYILNCPKCGEIGHYELAGEAHRSRNRAAVFETA